MKHIIEILGFALLTYMITDILIGETKAKDSKATVDTIFINKEYKLSQSNDAEYIFYDDRINILTKLLTDSSAVIIRTHVKTAAIQINNLTFSIVREPQVNYVTVNNVSIVGKYTTGEWYPIQFKRSRDVRLINLIDSIYDVHPYVKEHSDDKYYN
jgi:hypothetical protein